MRLKALIGTVSCRQMVRCVIFCGRILRWQWKVCALLYFEIGGELFIFGLTILFPESRTCAA